MLTILDHCASQAVAMDAGRLKSLLAVAEIHAAVKENFSDVDGGHKCKLCGEVVGHPRAAAAHLAVHHRKALEAGGPGSGCQGPNCGRKVGTTPDHTGKIPVPADIARTGAGLAESLHQASNRLDWAEREKSQLSYTKSGQRRTGPKFRREIEEAQNKSNAVSKIYQAESAKSRDFEKENGIHPVQAWEAHHDRDWPHYRVNTSGKGRQYYVPK